MQNKQWEILKKGVIVCKKSNSWGFLGFLYFTVPWLSLIFPRFFSDSELATFLDFRTELFQIFLLSITLTTNKLRTEFPSLKIKLIKKALRSCPRSFEWHRLNSSSPTRYLWNSLSAVSSTTVQLFQTTGNPAIAPLSISRTITKSDFFPTPLVLGKLEANVPIFPSFPRFQLRSLRWTRRPSYALTPCWMTIVEASHVVRRAVHVAVIRRVTTDHWPPTTD